jgi:hypothetical protein
VRFWDVASGTQVRQVAASEFAFDEGPSDKGRTNRHVLTVAKNGYGIDSDMLLISALPPSGGEQQGAAAPVACFKAPANIFSVRRHGVTICVGCRGGAVCILQAPFLAA